MNDLIVSALASLNIPVSHVKYSGTATTYVTFFEYNEQGAQYSEDKEKKTTYYMQVDLWSLKDQPAIGHQMKSLLLNAGFNKDYYNETYETDTKIFHTVLRVNFTS